MHWNVTWRRREEALQTAFVLSDYLNICAAIEVSQEYLSDTRPCTDYMHFVHTQLLALCYRKGRSCRLYSSRDTPGAFASITFIEPLSSRRPCTTFTAKSSPRATSLASPSFLGLKAVCVGARASCTLPAHWIRFVSTGDVPSTCIGASTRLEPRRGASGSGTGLYSHTSTHSICRAL